MQVFLCFAANSKWAEIDPVLSSSEELDVKLRVVSRLRNDRIELSFGFGFKILRNLS